MARLSIGEISGKSLVFIPVLVAIVVLVMIYVPQLGQPTLKLGVETVAIVDWSASGATSPDGTRDLKMITILGHDGILASLDLVFGNNAMVGAIWNRTRGRSGCPSTAKAMPIL